MLVRYKVWWLVMGLMLWYAVPGRSQQVQERLIVKDAGDSLLLHAFRCAFDTSGDYYFGTMLKGKGDKYALTTNKKKLSPLYWGTGMAIVPYKSYLANAFFSDSTHTKLYYKNRSGTKLYGPHAGKIREVLEFGRDNVVMELCVGAKSYLYINDMLVNVADSLKQHWLCDFSNNNNVLYSVYKNGMYKLYLNHKIIDSGAEAFTGLGINDNNFYTYAKPSNGKYTIHAGKRVFGPVGSVDFNGLSNDNAYYFRGCADSECYVLVNDTLIKGIAESHSNVEDPVSGTGSYVSNEQMTVQPYNRNHYQLSYNQNNDNGTFMNIDGKVSHFNYTLTGLVATDQKGGYAFWGYREDPQHGERVYKNINGIEKEPETIKKQVFRTHPMYVDPSGESFYYLETIDSIFFYRDDKLFCKPLWKKKFMNWDMTSLPLMHPDGMAYFQGMNLDATTYLVYNNTISRPLPLINPKYDRMDPVRKGSIVAGDITHDGFFIMINIAPKKYLLVINNQVYQDIDGVDEIFGEQSYFDAHSVTFFGTKDGSFYEFKVKY